MTIRYRLALAVSILAVSGSLTCAASADEKRIGFDELIAKWSNQEGIVLVEGAQTSFKALAIRSFITEASSTGLEKGDIDTITDALLANGSISIASKPDSTLSVYDLTGMMVYETNDPTKVQLLRNPFEFISTKMIDRFPFIKVEVDPTPPLDYIVEIYGREYQATEKGEYGVPPGRVDVQVRRGNRPPCKWSGEVREGERHVLTCKLPL